MTSDGGYAAIGIRFTYIAQQGRAPGQPAVEASGTQMKTERNKVRWRIPSGRVGAAIWIG